MMSVGSSMISVSGLKMGNMVSQAFTTRLSIGLFLFLTLLIESSSANTPLPDSSLWPIKSRTRVKLNGADLGPASEFSKKLLKSGESFKYICRWNGPTGGSNLCRKQGTECRIIERSELVGQTLKGRICPGDTSGNYECIINNGEILWNRDKGGEYSCSAVTSESFLVLWYSDEITVSRSQNLEISSYGQGLNFFCGMDITPITANYAGVMKVQWQWSGQANSNTWTNLRSSPTHRFIVPNTGSNYTLNIPSYSPITHGGSYRCVVSLYGNPPKTSGTFTITSRPKLLWRNNRRSFASGFGTEEAVNFWCDVWSYPFPDRIEMAVDGNVLSAATDGVSDFSIEKIDPNVKNHFGKFSVSNMSAVFTNQSTLECRVFRNGKEERFINSRIILHPEPPPIETTTGFSNPNVRLRVQKKKPWVIAIAVIIPIVVVLVIVVVIVLLRYRKYGDEGGMEYEGSPQNSLHSHSTGTTAYKNPPSLYHRQGTMPLYSSNTQTPSPPIHNQSFDNELYARVKRQQSFTDPYEARSISRQQSFTRNQRPSGVSRQQSFNTNVSNRNGDDRSQRYYEDDDSDSDSSRQPFYNPSHVQSPHSPLYARGNPDRDRY